MTLALEPAREAAPEAGQLSARDRIIAALRDPQWDFRTPGGIAEETELDEAEVAAELERLVREKVARRSVVPDHKRRKLYTMADREWTGGEKWGLLRNIVAGAPR